MIDAIYCVSLNRLEKRRKGMIELLTPFADEFDVYFLDAIDWEDFSIQEFHDEGFFAYEHWKLETSNNKWYSRDVKMGELGCMVSHYLIWNHIYSNHDRALILEDDCHFPNGIEKFIEGLNRANKFMNQNDCDIFYLGCWPHVGFEGEKIDDHIEKCNMIYTTHSYIVTKDSAKELFSSGIKENLIAADDYLSSTFCEHPREDIRNLYTNRKLKAYRLIDDVTDQNVSHNPKNSSYSISDSEIERSSFISTDSYTARSQNPYYNLFYDVDHLIWILEDGLSERDIESIRFEVISEGRHLADALYDKEDFKEGWELRVPIPSDEVSYTVKIDDKIVETGIKRENSLFFDNELFR